MFIKGGLNFLWGGKMRKDLVKRLILIFSTSSLVLLIVAVILIATHFSNKKEEHSKIETIIVEKYTNEGQSMGLWMYKTKEFVIVSKDNKGDTWTSKVNESDYNSYNLGDVFYICSVHNKPTIYE